MKLRPEYQRRTPNELDLNAMNYLAEQFSTLAECINQLCPGANKYRAKALTDLECVAMLCNKAITHGE